MAEGRRERETHPHDEMLICARCGVTFLWTFEEQRRHAEETPPVHCPACRRLLPPPGRERGVVKWYSARKKYGFVTRQKGPEVFIHRSRFVEPRRLGPGDLVEFRVEMGERGPVAVDVRLLARARELDALPQPEPGPVLPPAGPRRRKSSS